MVESIELLTPNEVCKSLKVSESTFFRLVRRNAFPVVRIGKESQILPIFQILAVASVS